MKGHYSNRSKRFEQLERLEPNMEQAYSSGYTLVARSPRV
jgi:hypothetical protein